MSASEPPRLRERRAANGTMIAAKQRQAPEGANHGIMSAKRSLYRDPGLSALYAAPLLSRSHSPLSAPASAAARFRSLYHVRRKASGPQGHLLFKPWPARYHPLRSSGKTAAAGLDSALAESLYHDFGGFFLLFSAGRLGLYWGISPPSSEEEGISSWV